MRARMDYLTHSTLEACAPGTMQAAKDFRRSVTKTGCKFSRFHREQRIQFAAAYDLCPRCATLLFRAVSGVSLSNKSPQVVAHRGASGWAPETTLAAYRKALHLKADFLEADVQMTLDGEIIAIHDESVDRTTNGRGPVRQMTLVELKGLDAGSWFNKMYPDRARPDYAGQKIPTLQEIMDLAKESTAGLYLETKNPELYPPHLESTVIQIIRRNGFEKRVVIQSFNPRSVERVKALDPSIPAALLIDALENDPVEATVKIHANEIAIDHNLVTRDIIQKAHERGLTVAVWTVDEHEDLKRMIALGVDAIITDYPDRLNRLLGK